ncbi:unnamed protein product [Calicophoron daubneyi]|uniref:Aminopeptidase N-like N-terminal domain-containing protein n=1 Tax=Calicophoron daubneyi TaxID=300641 RepID=A0AAV2TNI5_CALDB
MAKEVFHRLPRLCIPLKYLVELKPCFKSITSSGKESVALQMSNGTSEIELNARNISVNKAKSNATDVEVVPKLESEKVVFRLGSPSLAGAATLDFKFPGRISDKMVGLYKSSYTGSNEEKKVMLATQSEPANARQAIPFWDEPDLKTVFSITLVVPKNITAISNMNTRVQAITDATLEIEDAVTDTWRLQYI